jgi:hypothetical protein
VNPFLASDTSTDHLNGYALLAGSLMAWPDRKVSKGVPIQKGSELDAKEIRGDAEATQLGEILGQSAAILLAGGLLVYALSSLAHDRFYGALGVEPGDVGITYASVLARSTGISIMLIAIIAVFTAYYILFSRWLPAPENTIFLGLSGRRIVMIISTTFVFLLILLIGFLQYSVAQDAASAVKSGRPVRPIGSWFTLMPIHADPVIVEPAGDPKEAPTISRYRCKITTKEPPCSDTLLYLGQAGGVVVLYNSTTQRSVYVPGSSVVLHISNCSTKRSPDVACKEEFRRDT